MSLQFLVRVYNLVTIHLQDNRPSNNYRQDESTRLRSRRDNLRRRATASAAETPGSPPRPARCVLPPGPLASNTARPPLMIFVTPRLTATRRQISRRSIAGNFRLRNTRTTARSGNLPVGLASVLQLAHGLRLLVLSHRNRKSFRLSQVAAASEATDDNKEKLTYTSPPVWIRLLRMSTIMRMRKCWMSFCEKSSCSCSDM